MLRKEKELPMLKIALDCESKNKINFLGFCKPGIYLAEKISQNYFRENSLINYQNRNGIKND